jgi:hypothetical protein
MNWTVAVIIVLLLIVFVLDAKQLVIAGIVSGIAYYLTVSKSQNSVSAGDWDCDLASGEYGSRCVPGNQYCNHEECEIRCLSEQEAVANIENIRKFVTARGYKFPVPIEFMEKFLDSKSHRDFCRKRLFGKMVFMMKQTEVRDSILQRLAPNVNIFRASIGHVSPGLLVELAERTKYQSLQEYAKRKAATGEKCVIDIKGYDDIYPIFEHIGTTAVDLLDLGCIEPPHANAAIINHGLKLITYFEPHVGLDYDYHKVVEEFLQPLNYQVDSTSTCPYGLQFVTGDSYCATWAIFGAILSIMNPGVPQKELLGYFIGQAYMVSTTLIVFMYYLYTEFNEVIESALPTIYNFKHLKEVTRKYKKLVLEVETIKNKNSAFVHVLSATYYILKALESTRGKLTNFWILDSAETLYEDLKLMITHQADVGELQRLSESCLQLIKRNFDLDKYGKQIHKYARKAEKSESCVLF